ncbi:MAG: hypothetical protein WCK91_03460 [bacterium]
MREAITSPRSLDIYHKRRVARIRLTILISILSVSIIGAAAYFSSDKHLTINNISITGTHVINKSDIEDIVRTDISGRYLYMFDRSNALIYPKAKIYQDLSASFHRIEHLSVALTNFNTLRIDIIERSGTYLYCGEQVPASVSDVGENCYFVNSEGYVFDRAPYFSGDVYFKYYMKVNDTGSVLGTQIIHPDSFHKLTRFIDSLTSIGFKSTGLLVEDSGSCTLMLESSNQIKPKINFRIDNDFDTILDNLTLAMNKPEFANQIKTKYAKLQYIDLRFKNKVLYKFNE